MRLSRKRTLVVVCIALVCAALVILAAFTFIPRNQAPSGNAGRGLAELDGYVTMIRSAGGPGVMNFNVVDEANYPLAGIAVVGVDPLLPDIINNVTFTYNRTPVSASNLLPVGDVANATADFSSGGQVGSSYTVTIMTTLTSGETMTYNESLSLGCTCTTGTSQGYYVNGTIDVPLGTGNGTLTVEIHDDGVNNDSITAVIFPSLGFENATSIPNSASLVLMLHGSPVSSQNPVLPGESAAGSISVVNMTAGTAYQINVVITFGNGSQEVEGLPIAAQL